MMLRELLLPEFGKFLIDKMNRKSHDGKERAFYAVNADIADPFLNTVGAGFVERSEIVHIVFYLTVGQFFEMNVCRVRNSLFTLVASQCQCSGDMMNPSG